MRALPSPLITITVLSPFERGASAGLLGCPRTGELATSEMTRVYAEEAAERNGPVRLYEAQLRR
jgi:hypothetical protein